VQTAEQGRVSAAEQANRLEREAQEAEHRAERLDPRQEDNQ
jgi:hypothetical protein